jgi:hypothetical protein
MSVVCCLLSVVKKQGTQIDILAELLSRKLLDRLRFVTKPSRGDNYRFGCGFERFPPFVLRLNTHNPALLLDHFLILKLKPFRSHRKVVHTADSEI